MPSSTKALHDWVRASFYRTGFAIAAFVALLFASTPAPIGAVPMVFLGTLPFALAVAYGVDWFQGNVGSETDTAAADGQSAPPSQRDRTVSGTEADAALQRLRERYADGELSDEAFERRIERLLETAELRDLVVDAARQRTPDEEPTPSTGETVAGQSDERPSHSNGTESADWFDDLGETTPAERSDGRERNLAQDR
jgi:hypothetical protein